MLDLVKSAGHVPQPMLETVTPAKASVWLRSNAMNRRMSKVLVAEYQRTIAAGRWRLNGETIKFSVDGKLLDGQHRLQACLEANRPFDSYVIRGLPDEAFDTIDIGRIRSAGDVIGMVGCSNANSVASAIRWLKIIRTGVQGRHPRMPADEVRAVFLMEPGIEESVRVARAVIGVMAPGQAAALHFLFAEKDPSAADQFIIDLGGGVGLAKNDPVYYLRERLLRTRVSRARINEQEVAVLCIKAWQRRRQASPRQVRLVGSTTKADKHNFPLIV